MGILYIVCTINTLYSVLLTIFNYLQNIGFLYDFITQSSFTMYKNVALFYSSAGKGVKTQSVLL